MIDPKEEMKTFVERLLVRTKRGTREITVRTQATSALQAMMLSRRKYNVMTGFWIKEEKA